jgi:4-oxalocrotonate tautomerase
VRSAKPRPVLVHCCGVAAMPIAMIHIMEGRDDAKKARAIEAVTQALVESLEVKIETVRVIVLEVPKAHWGIAGKPVGKPRE